MSEKTFEIEDLILFILENSKPNMGIKKLNKLAFLLEFAYLFEHQKPLTNADFAAIDMGPVINNYKALMERLTQEKKICRNEKADVGMDDYLPLERYKSKDVDTEAFLKMILEKYNKLSPKELETLTHGLDSYNITVHENGGAMGAIIDKDLALLDYSLSTDEL